MGNENHPKMVKGMYGPTKVGHYYKPAYYHNRTSRNPYKTRWKLKPTQQYEVFRIADESLWLDEKSGGLFSILDKGEVELGTTGERLAFFPVPANKPDPWHGYPVAPEGISRTLVWNWFNEAIIDKIMRNRLLRFAR